MIRARHLAILTKARLGRVKIEGRVYLTTHCVFFLPPPAALAVPLTPTTKFLIKQKSYPPRTKFILKPKILPKPPIFRSCGAIFLAFWTFQATRASRALILDRRPKTALEPKKSRLRRKNANFTSFSERLAALYTKMFAHATRIVLVLGQSVRDAW